MVDERRQHYRYSGPSEALAVLKPHPIKLGQIVNISEGGLAFQYTSDSKIDTKYIELDIFISAEGQQYNAFPFTAIRDFRVSSTFESSTPKRQLCIKFDSLTNEQTLLLKNFICHHAA